MPETPAFPLTLGGVDARWIGGALWLSAGHGGLLIDAPAGVHAALAATGLLGSLQAVLVSSARTRAVSGLIGLWDALGGSTRRSLRTMYVLGDERTPLLAQAWSQGWPDHVRLDVDGLAPGSFTDAVGLDIELVPLRIGEPGHDGPRAVAGCGLRVTARGATIAWTPGCRPGTAASRLCAGADLAVIEIAVTPWPRSDVPWRMTRADALRAGLEAQRLWVVGDDGTRVDEELQ